MPMKKHYLLILSNPVDGKEDEYNKWYTDTHLHDVVKVPGFVSAQRFELSEAQMQEGIEYKYLAIYEIETDNIKAAIDALGKARNESMVMSSALDRTSLKSFVFIPISDKIFPESILTTS